MVDRIGMVVRFARYLSAMLFTKRAMLTFAVVAVYVQGRVAAMVLSMFVNNVTLHPLNLCFNGAKHTWSERFEEIL